MEKMIIDNHSLDCGAARFGPGPFLRHWPKMAPQSIRVNILPKAFFVPLLLETHPLLAAAGCRQVRTLHDKKSSINLIDYFLSFFLIQIYGLAKGGVDLLAEG